MSMQSSFVYGFGFECTNIDTEHFMNFIKNHDQSTIDIIRKRIKDGAISQNHRTMLSDILQLCRNHKKDELYPDILELKETYDDISEPLFSAIAEIMEQETEIPFEFQQGQEDVHSPECILFVQAYPWNLSYKAKELTSDDALREIMKPYAKELGVNSQDIDYLEIEYYG